MKKILLLLIAALTMTMASAKDIKTVVLTTVPQMHCENCEKRIKENIRFEKGVKKIVTDVEHQTVTITYDADKTTVENIIKGFEKIKYNAREVKEGEHDIIRFSIWFANYTTPIVLKVDNIGYFEEDGKWFNKFVEDKVE